MKNQLSPVQHKIRRADPRRRLRHDARGAAAPFRAPAQGGAAETLAESAVRGEGEAASATPPWPDLVLIDGGQGQLAAAREALVDLGINDVPLVGRCQGARPGCGPGDILPERAPPLQARATRPGALFRAAASRRGPPVRDRCSPPEALKIHARRRTAGDRRHWAAAQAGASAALRNVEGHLPRFTFGPGIFPGIDATTARKVYGFFHETDS